MNGHCVVVWTVALTWINGYQWLRILFCVVNITGECLMWFNVTGLFVWSWEYGWDKIMKYKMQTLCMTHTANNKQHSKSICMCIVQGLLCGLICSANISNLHESNSWTYHTYIISTHNNNTLHNTYEHIRLLIAQTSIVYVYVGHMFDEQFTKPYSTSQDTHNNTHITIHT